MMTMTAISDLALAAVTLISPALPYLTAAGTVAAKGLADGIGKAAGASAWKGVEAVWKRMTAAASDDAKLKGAIDLVKADPLDEQSLAMLRKTIQVCLERDPAFKKDLLEAMGGEQSVQEMVARRGSRISGSEQQNEGSGRLVMEASDNSVIENSRQVKRS
jgi:hypothetical protein